VIVPRLVPTLTGSMLASEWYSGLKRYEGFPHQRDSFRAQVAQLVLVLVVVLGLY
jgi:hypothetical protein